MGFSKKLEEMYGIFKKKIEDGELKKWKSVKMVPKELKKSYIWK